jgi:hypothetical protein
MNDQFYDIVDSQGNVVETAEEQRLAALQEASDTVDPVTDQAKEVVMEQAPKQLTIADIRKLNKVYVTVQCPIVAKCGHRLNLNTPPRHRNCESCWFAWLNEHGELVKTLVNTHVENPQIIVQVQGAKFLKRFRQFMSTLAAWQKQQEEANEQVESGNTGMGDGN